MSIFKCVVCDGELRAVEIPRQDLFVCTVCNELQQRDAAGDMMPLSGLLGRLSLGDDRARAALSTPHVSTLKSFLDIFDQAELNWSMTIKEMKGGLRTVLAQIGNRIDTALQAFTGMDLASDRAGEGLRALREARELVSVLPRQNRGIAHEPPE